MKRSRSVFNALSENGSNPRLGLTMSRGASSMNAVDDKTVDCLNIRFPVTRGRRRSAVLDLRFHSSPAKKGVSRIAIRGVAETFREMGLFDSGHATWRKPRLPAIAPRIEYPFAPLVCAAAPLPCSRSTQDVSGSATKFLPAAGWPRRDMRRLNVPAMGIETLIPAAADECHR
jgi:hypothetical protein